MLVMAGMSYTANSRFLVQEVKESVRDLASIAASQVDGDVFATIEEGGEESEAYQQIFDQLSPFLNGDMVEYIYSMKKDESGETVFVVDTDTEEGAAVNEEYGETIDELEQAFDGEATTDSEVTTDEWGSFLSGYAPIYNSKQEVVGIVGVDCTVEAMNRKTQTFILYLAIIAGICLAVAIILAIFPARTLKRRLHQVNAKLADVVYNDGDLTRTVDIHTGDEFEEIANNLNALFEQTRAVVGNIKACSEEIHQVSENVDDTMHDAKGKITSISDYLQKMGAGIDLTARSLEEIHNQMNQVGDSVHSIHQDSAKGAIVATEITERSKEMMANVVSSQQDLTAEVEKIRNELVEKAEKVKTVEQIQTFTEDILKIASQTRMLALNANIEAARAGEMGKGFAVVAGSIGQLAENSGDAAANIQEESKEIIHVVQDMANLSQTLINYISETILPQFEMLSVSGKQYAEDAAYLHGMLEQFETEIETVSQAVQEVQAEIEVVTKESVQNNSRVMEVSDHAESLTAGMQYTTDMSEKNKKQADHLTAVVGHYKV